MAKVVLDLDTFKALASPTRLEVLRSLDERRKTVTELARDLELNKATVHEHLQILSATGLIKKRDDEGRKWIYYELTWAGQRLLHPQETTTFAVMLGLSMAAAGGGVTMLGRALGWWWATQGPDLVEEEATRPAGGQGAGQPGPALAEDSAARVEDEGLAPATPPEPSSSPSEEPQPSSPQEPPSSPQEPEPSSPEGTSEPGDPEGSGGSGPEPAGTTPPESGSPPEGGPAPAESGEGGSYDAGASEYLGDGRFNLTIGGNETAEETARAPAGASRGDEMAFYEEPEGLVGLLLLLTSIVLALVALGVRRHLRKRE